MAEESQNALLKTLEEPPAYAHLILITAEPAGLLETVRSRLPAVGFAAVAPASLERRLAADLPGALRAEIAALAALADGDLGRARLLGAPDGARLRDRAEAAARAAIAGELAARPWAELLELADASAAEEARQGRPRGGRRACRRDRQGPRREPRPSRWRGGRQACRPSRPDRGRSTSGSPSSLPGIADLAALGEGAPELVRNRDRSDRLEADAARARSGGGTARGRSRDGHPAAAAGQRQRGPGARRALPSRRGAAG